MFGSLDLLQLLNSALCFAPERVCDQHRPPFQPPLTVHHQFVLFASLPCLEKSYRSPHPPLIPLPLQLCCDCLFALLKPFFASPFKIILSVIELDQCAPSRAFSIVATINTSCGQLMISPRGDDDMVAQV